MSVQLDAAFVSDKGRRARNEDAAVCPGVHGLYAVIDGMGGQAGGDRAAAIARDVIHDARDPVGALVDVNRALLDAVAQDASLEGMGCVATVASLEGGSLRFAHVGDTMAYVVSVGSVDALTRRHTKSAELQREHALVDAEVAAAGGSNLLTLDLGGHRREGTDWIDAGADIPFEQDDLLVICSDGVHGAMPASELTSLLRSLRHDRADAQAIASTLVSRALALGSTDNATALVVRAVTAPRPVRRDVEAPLSRASSKSGATFAAGLCIGLLVGGIVGAWLASSHDAAPGVGIPADATTPPPTDGGARRPLESTSPAAATDPAGTPLPAPAPPSPGTSPTPPVNTGGAAETSPPASGPAAEAHGAPDARP